MRKHYLMWLLAALLVPVGANAQETLTVADGTATNGYVPIYGYYADAYLHSQMIYPASMLSEMDGGTITELVWYMTSPSTAAWGVNVVVSMTEVNDSNFAAGGFNSGDLTEVWSGNVDGTSATLDIELDEPYVYGGGNLLIDVYTTTLGSFSSCSWTGVSQTAGSVSGYSYSSTSSISATTRAFLPKATFTYSSGGTVCRKPGSLTLDDATTESLTFHWTQRNDAGTPFEISIDGTVVEPSWVDTFYTATGLNHSTPYTVKVRALCDDESTSGYTTLVMRTLCAAIDEFPYNTSFEGDNLDCWIVPANDSWGILNNPSRSYEGSYCMGHVNQSGYYYTTADSYIISPEIVVPDDATDMEFSWFGRIYGNYLNSEPGSYEVLISSTADTVINESYEVILTLDSIYNGNYIRQSIMLEDYAGQTIRVAFHHTSVTTASNWRYLLIDNLAIQNMNRPMAHIGRYSYRHGSTEADVMVTEQATFEAWLTSGSEDNLQYYWTSARADAGEATLTANGDMVTMVYDVPGKDTLTLEAINDAGSSSVSLVVNIDTFDLATLPFFCGFNSEAEYAPWVLFSLDSTVLSGYGLFNPAYSGSYAAGSFALADGARTDVMLVSPAIAVPENVGNMSLIYHAAGFIYDDDTAHPATYDVLVSNSGRSSYIYFTDTILHDTMYQNAYEDRNLNLNGYAGDTIYLAFRHTSLGAQGLVIDEIEIREAAFPVIDVDYVSTALLDDTVSFTAIMTEGITEGATYTWTSTMEAAGTADMVASDADSIYTLHYTATGYDTVKVVVTNNFGSDSMTVVVRIRDLNPAPLPYVTGFEDSVENTYWQLDNGYNAWYIDTAAHNGGSYGLYISADSGATCGYDIASSSISHAYRAIHFDQAGQYAVSFDWQANGEGNYDYIRAYMAPVDATLATSYSGITYGSLPNGYIAIDGGDRLNQSTGWQTATETFTIDAPVTMLMVFSWRNDASVGSQPPAAIDNIDVRMLSCPQPTAIAIDSTGSDYIAFSWVPAGEETEWEVTIDSVSTVVTDTFFTAENLEANTEYTISVRAICGEGDSSFRTNVTTRTECDAIALPYFEDFENGGEQCWRIQNYYSSSNTGLSTSYSLSGTHSHAFYPGYNYQPVFAVMPRMSNVNTLMTTFNILGSSYIVAQVGTMASPDDTSSFVPLYTINNLNYNGWAEHEVRFDADTTGNEFIAFRFGVSSSWGYYAYLDDVTVMVAPSCQRPESVSVSDIEADGATIDITDSTDVNNYQIIVVNTSTGDTVYNQLVNSASQQVTGLEAFTSYSVTAYAICDDGNATSAVHTTFRTACEGGNCEFTVAMVDSYGDGWNGNAINVWQNGDNVEALTIASGSSNTANVSVCLGSDVALTWQSGSYAYETSFSITKDDSTILYIADGSDLSSGDTLVVFDGQCGVSYVYGGSTPIDTIPEPPQPVVCNAPSINAATATDATVTVVWSGNASSYEVAIVEGAWQAPAAGTAANGPSYTFTGLNASTQYTVGVRSVCDDTVSAWATRAVTTASNDTTTEGIDGVMAASFGLYPNPASSTVTVDLGGESTALVAVIDQSGRKSGEWRVESGKLEINVSDMAKGAYFVRVTTNSGTSVRKLIVK